MSSRQLPLAPWECGWKSLQRPDEARTGNGVEQGLQSHMTTGARQVTLTGELGQVKGHEDGVTVMKVGDCLLLSCCPFSANRKHGPRAAGSSDFQDKVEKLMFA